MSEQTNRSIKSPFFFHCGEFIGLRHTDNDFRDDIMRENLSLFDLRQDVYKPKYSSKDCQKKYLKYTKEKRSLDIKEICVSKDDRIIASPHEGGV